MNDSFLRPTQAPLLLQRTLPTLLALVALSLGATSLQAQNAPTSISPNQPMKQFVIIFRQGPHPLTDADKARRQTAVSAWAREQNAAGHKLDPRILTPEAARPGVAPSPEALGSWPITALLFLDARDLDEATAVAASHPAKDYNVAMEVRPWSTPVPAPAKS